jgi:hypothetical protein
MKHRTGDSESCKELAGSSRDVMGLPSSENPLRRACLVGWCALARARLEMAARRPRDPPWREASRLCHWGPWRASTRREGGAEAPGRRAVKRQAASSQSTGIDRPQQVPLLPCCLAWCRAEVGGRRHTSKKRLFRSIQGRWRRRTCRSEERTSGEGHRRPDERRRAPTSTGARRRDRAHTLARIAWHNSTTACCYRRSEPYVPSEI